MFSLWCAEQAVDQTVDSLIELNARQKIASLSCISTLRPGENDRLAGLFQINLIVWRVLCFDIKFIQGINKIFPSRILRKCLLYVLVHCSVKNQENLPCLRPVKIGSVLYTVAFTMPARLVKSTALPVEFKVPWELNCLHICKSDFDE